MWDHHHYYTSLFLKLVQSFNKGNPKKNRSPWAWLFPNITKLFLREIPIWSCQRRADTATVSFKHRNILTSSVKTVNLTIKPVVSSWSTHIASCSKFVSASSTLLVSAAFSAAAAANCLPCSCWFSEIWVRTSRIVFSKLRLASSHSALSHL